MARICRLAGMNVWSIMLEMRLLYFRAVSVTKTEYEQKSNYWFISERISMKTNYGFRWWNKSVDNDSVLTTVSAQRRILFARQTLS